MVIEAFGTFEVVHEVFQDQVVLDNPPLENNTLQLNVPREHEILMEELTIKATTPLYERSAISMLFVTLLLFDLSIMHGVIHTFVDELFSLLRKELLSKNNKLPATSYEARKPIKTLGFSYDSIHTCINGCVLFQGNYKLANLCPKLCNTLRSIEGS
jgi:hypothetical protein